jgi:dTDP-D-glucose 4,6-dehydratase
MKKVTVIGWSKSRMDLKKIHKNSEDWTFISLTKFLDNKSLTLETNVLVIASSLHLAKIKAPEVKKYSFDDWKCKIVKLIKNSKISRLIYISSAAVYGLQSNPSHLFEELDVLNGKSEYAFEKIRLEKIINSTCKDLGIKLYILRPSGFFGHYAMSGTAHSFLDTLAKAIHLKEDREFIIEHNGEQIRDFISIKDFFRIALKLINMKSEIKNTIFNITTDKIFTINQLIKLGITNGLNPKCKFKFIDKTNEDIHCALNNQRIIQSLALPSNFEKVDHYLREFSTLKK